MIATLRTMRQRPPDAADQMKLNGVSIRIMSNILENVEGECEATRECDAAIELLIDPREKDLGGFSVRRVLPFSERRMVGPWVFFDHAGPVQFDPGNGIDVRPHPHIGLATVSYLFEGAILHRDSLGFEQRIVPGAINWMTAGSGIVHSERTPDDLRASGHKLELLQLWLALPDDKQEIPPHFSHYAAASIPQTQSDGVQIRVLIGEAHGVKSPVETYSPTLYAEYLLDEGASLVLPAPKERAVYVVDGAVDIGDQTVARNTMAVLCGEQDVAVRARKGSRLVLIGGDPVGKRHVYWNFVSTSKERIEQAKQDWMRGNFASVPGDKTYIPLPE